MLLLQLTGSSDCSLHCRLIVSFFSSWERSGVPRAHNPRWSTDLARNPRLHHARSLHYGSGDTGKFLFSIFILNACLQRQCCKRLRPEHTVRGRKWVETAQLVLIVWLVTTCRNKYFHKKRISQELQVLRQQGQKQSSSASVQPVRNRTCPGEEEIRSGCPSGQRCQLTIADKSSLAVTFSNHFHLEM